MIDAPATLGVFGGGQLGKYFVIAAHKLGYKVVVLDPDKNSPAGQICDQHIIANYDDIEALDQIISTCRAATTEFENIPIHAYEYVNQYIKTNPSSTAIQICQDRSLEKTFLNENSFITAPFLNINATNDCIAVDNHYFPGILKLNQTGYDGKGQVLVTSSDMISHEHKNFNHRPCILEKKLAIDYELSVVLARNESGVIEYFPVAQNIHQHGILSYSIIDLDNQDSFLINQAITMAKNIAEKLNYIGVLSTEFFVVNNQLYVNELAPRPHNSGHYTLDTCVTNQFEQQVRALCGLPLGSTTTHSCAIMINIFGDVWYKGSTTPIEPDWHSLLKTPNLKLHLYGKKLPKLGRKMGHYTILGASGSTIEDLKCLAAETKLLI